MISVIVPTLWKPEGFLERLEEISKNANVGEIILIDNSALNVHTSHIPKLKHIKEESNTYVIPAWNKGVKLSKYDKLLIVNDDVETDWNIIDVIYNDITEDKGLIGAGVSCWQSNNKVGNIAPASYMTNCYACLFFVHKNSYIEIPEMKVHFGDLWIFDKITSQGKFNYQILDWDMGGESEQTSGLPEFNVIKEQDSVIYDRLK